MRYFIHSVQTYATSGKTRKGALLQAVAERFEGVIIDGEALAAMVRSFRNLVAAVNRKYKGKPLFLATGDGWICVKPEFNGNDNHVFCISFKPVRATLYASSVEQQIYDTVCNVARDIAGDYRKGGEE